MSERLEVTPEEFRDWIANKITKNIFADIIEIRDELKNYLASGSTLDKDATVSTDRIVGRIEGMTELFNMFREPEEKVPYEH